MLFDILGVLTTACGIDTLCKSATQKSIVPVIAGTTLLFGGVSMLAYAKASREAENRR